MPSKGRPKGLPKSGGRQKGVPNKTSLAKERWVAESGLTPLAYMLSVLRNEDNPQDVRLDAAKSAAPYVHPRLNAVDLRTYQQIVLQQEAPTQIVDARLLPLDQRDMLRLTLSQVLSEDEASEASYTVKG